MEWKTRKRGKGKQKGTRFLVSKSLSGNAKADVLKERYLQFLMRESKTYDIGDTIMKFNREAKATSRRLRKLENSIRRSQVEANNLRLKIEVLLETLNTLKEIVHQGRTRIGETELKVIVRKVAADKGAPPSILEK